MKRIFTLPDSIRNFSRRRQTPRQQTRQQRGTILVLTSVTLVGMVGMLALAVDLGYLFSLHTQLQNGVNAAALAAGAGLRVTIESDASAAEQTNVVNSLAKVYGGKNQVRRSEDPKKNEIDVKARNVIINTDTDIPTVQVRAFNQTPLIFAPLFTTPLGFSSINMSATATASLIPVDGGSGTIASGARRAGCWRPIFLPDTFYDQNGLVQIVGETGLGGRLPNQPNDYYRSRFAAGARNTFPFIDAFSTMGPSVTGLRDTKLQSEIGSQSIMGQLPYVTFSNKHYFVADFSVLPRDRVDALSPDGMALFGYCGEIRVGREIPVFPQNPSSQSTYFAVRSALKSQSQTVYSEAIDPTNEALHRYIVNTNFPDPNTFPAIIPVLLYNPIIWKDDVSARAKTSLTVTNIGVFFLKNVTLEGDLEGYFLREIIAGGTPIDPANMDPDGPNFKRTWLPMSVQLLPNK